MRGKSAVDNHIPEEKNYEWSQLKSGVVGLADISVARLDIMIKSRLTNESP